jgi:hypothetical protein
MRILKKGEPMSNPFLRPRFLIGVVAALFFTSGARAEILLSDVVAGGDGSGNAPPENWGINPDDGTFVDWNAIHVTHAIFNSGDNPQVIPDDSSPYLDSVFIIEEVPMAINSAGVIFEFSPGDANTAKNTWDHILKDRTTDVDKGYEDVWTNNQVYQHGVGMAGSAGITFDLDALREKHGGENVGFFSAVVGQDRCGTAGINDYVFFSDDLVVFEEYFKGTYLASQGEEVGLLIPPEAKYLTLAVGTVNGDLGCDHGVFADARISRTPKVLVTRTIPALLPATKAAIALDVNELIPVTSLEIREVIPRGFTASDPSGGGNVEEDSPSPGRQTVVWKFNGNVDSGVLTYDLSLPNPYPLSSFKTSISIADGETNPIVGDRDLKNGLDGFVREALAITLRQPTTGCVGANPGLAALRSDYLTDGESISELTVVPAAGESVSPDYQVSSPSPGPTTPLSAIWTRMTGPAGWIELNTCDECMAYLAFYVTVPEAMNLAIGSASDDSEQILIDGNEVWAHAIGRGSGAAFVQDRSLLFNLSAGKHLVLQKIFEGCGGFNGAFRFEDEDQNPLILPITLDPSGYETPGAFVLRDIPSTLDTDQTCRTIVLKIRVEKPTVDARIEENVPAGFTICDVSDGGVITGQRITWNLPGNLSNRDLRYRISLPAGATDGEFQGVATLSGVSSPIAGKKHFNRGSMNSDGFIKEWLVLGPLDTFGLWPGDGSIADPDGPSATPENGDLRVDYLTDGTLNEQNIRPFEGMRISPLFKGDGLTTGAKSIGLEPILRTACAPAEPTWERFVTRSGTFYNEDYFGGDVNSHATYAACYVTNFTGSPLATNVAIDSDDNFIAFLNGVEVIAFENGPCGTALGCGRGMGAEGTVVNVAPVTLPPGESFLLTRVHDGYGGSGIRLRFQDANGKPLLPPDIRVGVKSASSPPAVTVRRSLSSESYRPGGDPLTVTLRVQSAGAHDVSIREVLPAGFSAEEMSDGGTFSGGQAKWTLLGVNGARNVTYRLNPGSCSSGGSFCGNGIDASEYTVDGAKTHGTAGDSSFRRDDGGTDDLGAWDVRDIGTTAGGTHRTGVHSIEVMGRGAGVRSTRDEFRFVSVPASGDFEVRARIDCLDDSGGSGVAGLMVRDTFDTSSAHAFFYLSSPAPGSGLAGTLKGIFRRETAKNRSSTLISITAAEDRDVLAFPVYLKLSRTNTKLSFQRSNDGAIYKEVASRDIGTGTSQINLRTDTLIGLAVSGGGMGPTRADFREVSEPEFTPQPPSAPTLNEALGGPKQVSLSWSAPASGPAPTAYLVLRKEGGSYVQVAEVPATPASYVDAGLLENVQYCYVVRSKRGSSQSANSNEKCGTTTGGGARFRRGDVDASETLDISDAVGILSYLFQGTGTPNCLEAADTDNSGDVDITDAVNNLGYQFLGQAPPEDPGPINCGSDPGTSFLGCDRPCP